MSEIQGIAPPDTQPDKAIPLPLPLPELPKAPSPPHTPSAKTIRSWAPLYLSKTDATVSRLSKILSTPSGTDTLLMTIGYTSLLTSSILNSISLARLHHTVRLIIEKAISLPSDRTVIITTTNLSIPSSRLLVLSARLKALYSMISDFRIFVRLWGFVGIWKWGKGVIDNPNADGVLRAVESTQVLASIFYQYLENGAYLSGKGVLGWSVEKQNKAWAWSSRFWALHVGLDFVRLWREIRLRREKVGGKDVEEERSIKAKWRREVVTNLAYAPMTLHWSVEQGLMSQSWVGLCGSVVGVTKIRQLWKNAL